MPETPRRVAPAATIASASAIVRTPPEALTPRRPPTADAQPCGAVTRSAGRGSSSSSPAGHSVLATASAASPRAAPATTSRGWWLALGHLTTAAAQAVTIVGVPLAVANLKLIPVTLFPYVKEIVDARMIPAAQRPLHSL